jgi:1-acyl-sn-glycerol-3-phosphate acyltransferase
MSGQAKLLTERRFLPFFLTQLLGAANDNIFKQAIIMLLAFKLGMENGAIWVNAAAGIFILPFFMFSGIAGQVAEKFDKDKVIRYCKLAEIIAMTLASAGFYLENPFVLISALFFMGSTSAFFGPAKYSIMPQHLKLTELVGGNALVEMGTFVAILFGTIVGSYLIMLANGELITSIFIIALAIIGYIASCKIPPAPSTKPNSKLNYNIFTGGSRLYKAVKKQPKSVFNSVLAISWFWFMGATFLAQIPSVAKSLNAENVAVTLLLATFSIGIAGGSLLCEKLSHKRIELGIVPIGSIGITIASLFFAYTLSNIEFTYRALPEASEVINSLSLLYNVYGTSIISLVTSLFLVGFFGGFFTIPLYAILQSRSKKEELSMVVAANNMLNAALMVGSAVFGIALTLGLGENTSNIFYAVAIINIFVAIYVYKKVPEFFFRFVAWVISHSIYRVRYNNFTSVPDEGGCIVAANHVSFLDPVVLFGAIHRPVKFVMFEPIYKIPVANFFFKAVGAIPIDSKKNNPEVFEAAFNKISEYLANGEVVCIFPEGKLSSNGNVDEFKRGILHILKKNPVPVMPVAINGLWGSMFSRKRKIRLPRPTLSKITLTGSSLMDAQTFDIKALENKVREMHQSNPKK